MMDEAKMRACSVARVVVVGDVHVGNHALCGGPTLYGVNARARQTVDVLRSALALAERLAAAFVVAGDLFDSDKASPQLVALVMAAFDDFPAVPVHIIPGNHDQRTDQQGDHACAPLALLRNVTVYDNPTLVELAPAAYTALVPFRRTPAAEYLPAAFNELRNAAEGLVGLFVAHAGIAEKSDPVYMRTAHDAIPVEALCAAMTPASSPVALFGNWHFPRDVSRQVGGVWVHMSHTNALVPTGWDNAGMQGANAHVVSIVDVEGGSYEFVRTGVELGGPRFVKVSTAAAWRRLVGECGALPETWDSVERLVYVWAAPETADDEAELRVALDAHVRDAAALDGVLPHVCGVRFDKATVASVAREAAHVAPAGEVSDLVRAAIDAHVAGTHTAAVAPGVTALAQKYAAQLLVTHGITAAQ